MWGNALTSEREQRRAGRRRPGTFGLISAAAFILAACQSTGDTGTFSTSSIDRSAGSRVNIESLSAVIEENPNDANAYNVRGSAFGQAGDLDSAIQDFDTAIRLDPAF